MILRRNIREVAEFLKLHGLTVCNNPRLKNFWVILDQSLIDLTTEFKVPNRDEILGRFLEIRMRVLQELIVELNNDTHHTLELPTVESRMRARANINRIKKINPANFRDLEKAEGIINDAQKFFLDANPNQREVAEAILAHEYQKTAIRNDVQVVISEDISSGDNSGFRVKFQLREKIIWSDDEEPF